MIFICTCVLYLLQLSVWGMELWTVHFGDIMFKIAQWLQNVQKQLFDQRAICTNMIICQTCLTTVHCKNAHKTKYCTVKPHPALPKRSLFYAISLCSLARNCFPWNTTLRTTNRHTISTKLICCNNTNRQKVCDDD